MTQSLSSSVLLILVADLMTVFRTEVAAEFIFYRHHVEFLTISGSVKLCFNEQVSVLFVQGHTGTERAQGCQQQGTPLQMAIGQEKRRRQWFTQVLYLSAHLRHLYFACVFYNVPITSL